MELSQEVLEVLNVNSSDSVEKENIEIGDSFEQQSSEQKIQNENGHTVFSIAAKHEDAELIRNIVGRLFALPDNQNIQSQLTRVLKLACIDKTAVHYATEKNNLTVFKALISEVPNDSRCELLVNKDADGYAAIHLAEFEIIKWIKNNSYSRWVELLEVQTERERANVLHWAAIQRRLKVVKYITTSLSAEELQRLFTLTTRDKDTVLQLLAKNGQLEEFKEVLGELPPERREVLQTLINDYDGNVLVGGGPVSQETIDSGTDARNSEEFTDQQRELDRQNEKVKKLQAENDALKKQLQQVNGSIELLQTENKGFKEKLQRLDGLLQKQKEEEFALYEGLKVELQQLVGQVKDLKEENRALRVVKEESERKFREITEQVKDLKEENSALRDKQRMEKDESERKLLEITEQLNTLTAGQNQLAKSMDEHQAAQQHCSFRHDRQREMIGALQRQLTEFIDNPDRERSCDEQCRKKFKKFGHMLSDVVNLLSKAFDDDWDNTNTSTQSTS